MYYQMDDNHFLQFLITHLFQNIKRRDEFHH
jgi:hypothetical protein